MSFAFQHPQRRKKSHNTNIWSLYVSTSINSERKVTTLSWKREKIRNKMASLSDNSLTEDFRWAFYCKKSLCNKMRCNIKIQKSETYFYRSQVQFRRYVCWRKLTSNCWDITLQTRNEVYLQFFPWLSILR